MFNPIQIKVSVKRKRKEFGAPCEFTDRNVADAKDGYIECTSYKDKTFDLQTVELDKGTQVSRNFKSLFLLLRWLAQIYIVYIKKMFDLKTI